MLQKWIPNKAIRNITEWALVLATAVLAAFLITTFLARRADVSGKSMEPTLSHGDVVVVNRTAYWFSEPKYGDIVVFPFPGDPSEYYIKRVVGLPGDEIGWVNGFFTRNGELLDDGFSSEPVFPLEYPNNGLLTFPVEVPAGTCFVLGDNRGASQDSRYSIVGCVPFKKLIGKVSLRVFPLSSFGGVK